MSSLGRGSGASDGCSGRRTSSPGPCRGSYQGSWGRLLPGLFRRGQGRAPEIAVDAAQVPLRHGADHVQLLEDDLVFLIHLSALLQCDSFTWHIAAAAGADTKPVRASVNRDTAKRNGRYPSTAVLPRVIRPPPSGRCCGRRAADGHAVYRQTRQTGQRQHHQHGQRSPSRENSRAGHFRQRDCPAGTGRQDAQVGSSPADTGRTP